MEKYKVLILEDDKNLPIEWKRVLESEGYSVDTAENGKIALDLWKRNIYDVVLVDLRVPEIDGRDVINTIKANQPDTQIIIISGQGKDKDLIDAINRHVFKYIPKSEETNLKDIIKSVDEAIQSRNPVLISLDHLAKKSDDEPILLAGRKSYTPKQLYDEVRKGTAIGEQFKKEFLETLTDFEPPKQTIDEILNALKE